VEGSDGTVSTGGQGTGGTKPDAGIDAGDFPLEGATWKAVPAPELSDSNCHFYAAEPGTLTFPPLKWTTCGDGCESIDLVQAYSSGPAGAVSANIEHGQAFLQFEIQQKKEPWFTGIRHFVRLEDGVTVAALVEHARPVNGFAPCLAGLPRRYTTAAGLYTTELASTPSMAVVGFSPTAPDGDWTWALPAISTESLPPSKCTFMTDTVMFNTGGGGVYALLDPKSSQWTTLESPSDSLWGGGEGDLAVWTEWNTNRIRAWAPDGLGVRTVLQSAPAKTCEVKPSPTKIVGVAQSADCTSGEAVEIRFWHMPRSYTEVASATVTPPLEKDVLLPPVGIRTRGDYAGVVAFDVPPGGAPTDEAHLVVVQVSTGKAWRVMGEPGYVVQEASWTIDDKWLYFGETIPGIQDLLKVHRVRRILLSKLDSWGQIL
jgi:hypothetical protein